MTPKDKAQDLFVKFYERFPDNCFSNTKAQAKFCAGVVVDEIISLRMVHNMGRSNIMNEGVFWELVKEELEKL